MESCANYVEGLMVCERSVNSVQLKCLFFMYFFSLKREMFLDVGKGANLYFLNIFNMIAGLTKTLRSGVNRHLKVSKIYVEDYGDELFNSKNNQICSMPRTAHGKDACRAVIGGGDMLEMEFQYTYAGFQCSTFVGKE